MKQQFTGHVVSGRPEQGSRTCAGPPTAQRGLTGPGTGRRHGRSPRATENPEPLAKSPSLCEGKDTPARDGATSRVGGRHPHC